MFEAKQALNNNEHSEPHEVETRAPLIDQPSETPFREFGRLAPMLHELRFREDPQIDDQGSREVTSRGFTRF